MRRAGESLQNCGVLPQVSYDRRRLEGEARERFFDTGSKRVARLATEIEAHTGRKLESCRALDFGCGIGRLSLPLAERCEHVYGVDVMPSVLEEAHANARQLNLRNVEWLETDRLSELAGRYDLVLSMWVFQHIPSREGERIFATILSGLRPGGVGAIHFTIRPSPLLSQLVRRTGRSMRLAYNPWSYMYMLMNSYSLNRLGKVLTAAGITEWHAKWHGPYPAVTLIFRKD
jgi:cyclopropane fatty-acyl-phospholipid synthase-like methyltransferase